MGLGGELFFPEGPGGVCHPLNVGSFDLGRGECHELYAAREGGSLEPGWHWDVLAHGEIARAGWNCSSAQACALGQLFMSLGALTTAGHYGMRQPPVTSDRWRARLWDRMALRARAAQWRELRNTLNERAAELLEWGGPTPRGGPTRPEAVTLGIHADAKSAAGKWRGQLELWRAYAAAHGLRWVLDRESYFDGQVFARYMGLYWASSDRDVIDFWREYGFLAPLENGWPGASFSTAAGALGDPRLLRGLVIFTQPPTYWDSIEALWAVLPQNEWTVWVDYDLTPSPCCFDVFSFVELIDGGDAEELPHIVLRDSPHEDYSHHCANAGFLVVRNSPVGRLFVELARRKRGWPSLPYGYQGALAESLLELLGLEWAVRGSPGADRGGGPPGYDSACMPHLALSSRNGVMSYANFCQCYRQELKRLAGPEGARTSRWVRFLDTRRGPEVGLLVASLFIHHASGQAEASERVPQGMDRRGAGFLPLTSWSRERHRGYLEAWLPWHLQAGGPCALLPAVVHWAGLPYRPRLIHEFLHFRFPRELPIELLANGSAEELAVAYRAAAAHGRRAWEAFLALPEGLRDSVPWGRGLQPPGLLTAGGGGNASAAPPAASLQERLARAACNLGSGRMWAVGGFTRWGRSTSPHVDAAR